ncbi:hypothetical protein AL755_08200 [Arthrobacter sp. ERGS1:01]|uniref:hypothetical protein n=1 Tax=Arthrobacter sp. ERGS1:01 TaxID=1704044 RepID=UPI0006CB094B|nr:hypothetical protein [Arthrobacter sp. ERGS1:01]ALE05463.1 hypothetical protein AL755_08200 [Arthrobacter sp. ERGS1:01]
MTNTTVQRLRPPASFRPQRGALAAIAAVVLLAGCSGGTGTPAATSPSVSQSATGSAMASATTPGATPTAEAAVKELVAGFPSKLIPLMPGADVQASSLQRSTPLSVAALTATVTAKPADVLAFYTKSLTSQGFTAQPGNSVEGVPLKTFVRASGQEIVTVSVVQTGSTSTVTIGANVLPASLK